MKQPHTLKELERYSPKDLVLCESADGWSLHAPGSTDEQIASGDAPYLLCGEGSPSDAHYKTAFARWLAQIAPFARLLAQIVGDKHED